MAESEVDHAAAIWSANETLAELVVNIDRTTELQWDASTTFLPYADRDKAKGLLTRYTMWSWLWAEDGFWSFSTSHTYAAAMMATKCDGYLESIHAPGRAMRFSIPDGILSNGDYNFRHCYTMDIHGGCMVTISEAPLSTVDGLSTNFSIAAATTAGIGALLCREDLDPELEEGEVIRNLQFKERALLLARRLAVGILYTMQNTTNWKERIRSTGTGNTRREPPPHRNLVVGAPLKLDARPQIKAWLRGGSPRQHGAPSLQHIVRGHYKRQVIGEGRSNRKVIWVEPYWRGPEGAPILVRERVVARSEQHEE